MRMALYRVAGLMVALAVAVPASAQFGHPLKGTWSGDWGTGKENRTHVLLELNWDGKAITGTINPGPNGAQMQKASLDPETWAVHLEADGKDASGKRYVTSSTASWKTSVRTSASSAARGCRARQRAISR